MPLQPNVNQRRRQYLVEIAGQLAIGTPITHVLNYTVSKEPNDKNHAKSIRTFLRNHIWNVTITESVEVRPGAIYPVQVKWEMPRAGPTCSHYYSNAGFLYSSSAIQKHTTKVLRKLTVLIRSQHPEFGNDWGLAFLVTRVLAGVHIQLQNAPGFEEDEEEDEDEDEEEEEAEEEEERKE